MQPQDLDWTHFVTGILGTAFGALSGVIASIWRLARIEPTIRADFKSAISTAEKRVEDKIEASGKKADIKREELVTQFHESFAGMRQQITNVSEKVSGVELDAQRRFVDKDEFKEFRDEYREDMRDLKSNLAAALARKPH